GVVVGEGDALPGGDGHELGHEMLVALPDLDGARRRRLLEADEVGHDPRGVDGLPQPAHRDLAAHAAGGLPARPRREPPRHGPAPHQNWTAQLNRGTKSMWCTPTSAAADNQVRPCTKARFGPTATQSTSAFVPGCSSATTSAPTRSSPMARRLTPAAGLSSRP